MTKFIKNQFAIFSFCLLAILPLSITCKNAIQAKNTQEALMLQTAENQKMLIEQQAMLMMMLQAWQEEQAMKRAEIQAQQQEQEHIAAMQAQAKAQEVAYHNKIEALSKELPNGWIDFDPMTAPMSPYIKHHFNKGCTKAAKTIAPAVAEIVLPMFAQRILNEIVASENITPFIEWLHMSPDEIKIAKLCAKQGVSYSRLKKEEQKANDDLTSQNIQDHLIHLELLQNEEYLQAIKKLKELEQYGSAVFLDDSLQKEHHKAIATMQHLKRQAHKKLTTKQRHQKLNTPAGMRAWTTELIADLEQFPEDNITPKILELKEEKMYILEQHPQINARINHLKTSICNPSNKEEAQRDLETLAAEMSAYNRRLDTINEQLRLLESQS